MVRHHQHLVLDLLDQPLGFEIGEHLFARREALQPTVFLGHGVVQMRVAVEDVDRFETVPAADLEIVEIVRRRDLDRAAALLGVGVFVGDDRDQPPDERQPHRLADQIGVARVVGMHRDAGVAEHRLRPGRRDDDKAAGFAALSSIG